MWCTNYQLITSSTSDTQIKTDRWICSGQVLCQVSWLIKKLIAWILGRYIFICIDGHCVDIYGYYETDANHDQARFSRRWFFAPDSRCKIIGFPIGWDIDPRAFLGRIIDYVFSTGRSLVNNTIKLAASWPTFGGQSTHDIGGQLSLAVSRLAFLYWVAGQNGDKPKRRHTYNRNGNT